MRLVEWATAAAVLMAGVTMVWVAAIVFSDLAPIRSSPLTGLRPGLSAGPSLSPAPPPLVSPASSQPVAALPQTGPAGRRHPQGERSGDVADKTTSVSGPALPATTPRLPIQTLPSLPAPSTVPVPAILP